MHKERSIGDDGKIHTTTKLPDPEEMDMTHHTPGELERIRHEDPSKYKKMMEEGIIEAEHMYRHADAHIKPPRHGIDAHDHDHDDDEPDMPGSFPKQPYASIKGLFLSHGTNFRST